MSFGTNDLKYFIGQSSAKGQYPKAHETFGLPIRYEYYKKDVFERDASGEIIYVINEEGKRVPKNQSKVDDYHKAGMAWIEFGELGKPVGPDGKVIVEPIVDGLPATGTDTPFSRATAGIENFTEAYYLRKDGSNIDGSKINLNGSRIENLASAEIGSDQTGAVNGRAVHEALQALPRVISSDHKVFPDNDPAKPKEIRADVANAQIVQVYRKLESSTTDPWVLVKDSDVNLEIEIHNDHVLVSGFPASGTRYVYRVSVLY